MVVLVDALLLYFQFIARTFVTHQSIWYSGWLTVAWLLAPLVSVAISLTLMTLPAHIIPKLWWCFMVLDAIHFANFVTEFFTVNICSYYF